MGLTKKDKREIALCRQLIGLLRKGYGKPCKTKDYEDFKKHSHELNGQGRCGCCAANEVIVWLEGHIELIRM